MRQRLRGTRSSSANEQLATLQGIAFDKTGTLTCGHLAVLEVQPLCVGISADRLLKLAAAAETQLRHPVARALVAHAQNIRGLELPMCEDVQFVIGMGVAVEVAGHRIHIGSARYLHSLGNSDQQSWHLSGGRGTQGPHCTTGCVGRSPSWRDCLQ
jgi:Cu2+-exporting ATPase